MYSTLDEAVVAAFIRLQWDEQESYLQTLGVDTVVYDALGCGQSAKPRQYLAYHPGELYEDLVCIYKSLAEVIPSGLSASI